MREMAVALKQRVDIMLSVNHSWFLAIAKSLRGSLRTPAERTQRALRRHDKTDH